MSKKTNKKKHSNTLISKIIFVLSNIAQINKSIKFINQSVTLQTEQPIHPTNSPTEQLSIKPTCQATN